MHFSDKNQNLTSTISKSETSSSVSVPNDRKTFQTKNTILPTNAENKVSLVLYTF